MIAGWSSSHIWPSKWSMENRLPSCIRYTLLTLYYGRRRFGIFGDTEFLFNFANFCPLFLDTVNGFTFHPYLPLAASSSGNRRFDMLDNFEENTILAGKNTPSFSKQFILQCCIISLVASLHILLQWQVCHISS